MCITYFTKLNLCEKGDARFKVLITYWYTPFLQCTSNLSSFWALRMGQWLLSLHLQHSKSHLYWNAVMSIAKKLVLLNVIYILLAITVDYFKGFLIILCQLSTDLLNLFESLTHLAIQNTDVFKFLYFSIYRSSFNVIKARLFPNFLDYYFFSHPNLWDSLSHSLLDFGYLIYFL